MTPTTSATPKGEDQPEPEYLTKAEVQAILHISRTTLTRLLSAGEIDVVRIGRGVVRITPAALRDYTERNTQRAAANRPRTRRQRDMARAEAEQNAEADAAWDGP